MICRESSNARPEESWARGKPKGEKSYTELDAQRRVTITNTVGRLAVNAANMALCKG